MDERAPAIVGAVSPASGALEPDLRRGTDVVSRQARGSPLPAALAPLSIDAAARDILSVRPQPSPVPAPTPKPVAPAPASIEPPPAQAPPLQLRYAGSMRGPDGRRVVYLSRGDASFEVAEGDRLDEGYVVETLGEETITLVYPPLGTKVTVAIPTAPAQ